MLTVPKRFFIISSYSPILLPLIATVIRLTPDIAALSYYIIAGYALFGKQQAIQALVLSWFFTMINLTIAPRVELITLLRYLVIACSFFSIFFRTSFFKFDRLTLFTLGLGIFIAIHSIALSPIQAVSFLKISSWTVVIITLFKAWSGLNLLEYERIKSWILNFILLITLLSLPYLFIPEIGYARNSDGFQGALNHPQVYGTTIALVTAILLGKLFNHNKPPLSLMIIIISLFLLIFISETRIAGIGLAISLMISLIFFFILNIFKTKTVVINKRLYLYLVFLILIPLIFNSYFVNLISFFLSKSGAIEVDGLFDAYLLSRGEFIFQMLDNIKENLITGIGFGIASDLSSMRVYYDPIFNLPISASVEKGVVPLMILEETGIFGFILFLIWILILFYRAVINGIESLTLLLAILSFNMGEAVLFSPGGQGLITLVLLASIVTRPQMEIYSSTTKHLKD